MAQPKKKQPSNPMTKKQPEIVSMPFVDVEKMLSEPDAPEALVFMGCGGSLFEWTTGLSEELEGLVSDTSKWFKMTTTGGRTDLVLPLKGKVNMGKLCIWRIRWGDCSWWSDYRENYADHHGVYGLGAPEEPEEVED